MKDAPSLMLNRLTWLLSADCALVGGVQEGVSVNCPSAGVVYRDTKSVKNVVIIIIVGPARQIAGACTESDVHDHSQYTVTAMYAGKKVWLEVMPRSLSRDTVASNSDDKPTSRGLAHETAKRICNISEYSLIRPLLIHLSLYFLNEFI